MAGRNRGFDAGKGVVEIDRPVVSVGNLSVGGTGKTPMVAGLVRVLRAMGRWPAVAMRGYAARGGESDEAAAYRAEFPDLPIVARADRLQGLIDLFATPEGERVDAVVLDDGFQHRRLARQCDIVLVDATRNPFEDRLLPAGWLREPVGSLARAHAVVVTHAEAVEQSVVAGIIARARGENSRLVIATARHAWSGLDVHDATGPRRESVSWLRGRRVVAACAIGNPGPFLEQVRRASGEVAGRLVLRDHDPYDAAAVREILAMVERERASAVVTTAKDWVKLRDRMGGMRVAVPRLELTFDGGGADLDELVARSVAASSRDFGVRTGHA